MSSRNYGMASVRKSGMRLIWVPIMLVIVPVVTIGACWGIAFHRKSSDQYVTYISSVIDKAPESCIGTLGLTVTAFILSIMVLSRYRHLHSLFAYKEKLSQRPDAFLKSVSFFQLVLGFFVAISLVGAASFQYSAVFYAHVVSIACCFGGSLIYIFIDLRLGFALGYASWILKVLRCTIAVVATLTLIPFIAVACLRQFTKTQNLTKLFVTINACAEICLSLSFLLYVATFASELRELYIVYQVHHIDALKSRNVSTEGKLSINDEQEGLIGSRYDRRPADAL
mmetsp:Transcript_13866/g.15306  ORF Transcript_13866/g.15306 Transcript_13866/m.15306 type:complete len:283 (-) Transcript_13866:83-931(-)